MDGGLGSPEWLRHCQGHTGNGDPCIWNGSAVSHHELLPRSYSDTFSESSDELQCKPESDMVRFLLCKDCGKCIVHPKVCHHPANIIRGHWLFLFFFSGSNLY